MSPSRRRSTRKLSARIGISLSESLLGDLDRVAAETQTPRSTLIQRAIEQLLRRRERAALVDRYVESYRLAPETAAEIEAAGRAAAELLAHEPWE